MKFHLKGLELQSKEFNINTTLQHNEYRLLDSCSRINADEENLLLLILGVQSLTVLVWLVYND